MEDCLSFPLTLLNPTPNNKTTLNDTTAILMDDISVTPSVHRAQDRAAHEYAENIHRADDSYKIVVGFLVPALLMVQWSVEWHNDDEVSWSHPLVAASLVGILCFMVLVPSFLQIVRNQTYMSLAPIACLSLADVCVIFRCDIVALIIMILGNIFMGITIVNQTKVVEMTYREESLREGLLTAPVDTSEGNLEGTV